MNKQYILFKLENQKYGIEIMRVKEIIEYEKTTEIPNVPAFVDGVINLRGDIIPVINLKKKFNMKEWEVQENSRIIIINIDNRQTGIVVDDASEVVNLHQKYIDDSPDIAMNIDEKYIMRIGRMDEEVIILLDLTELLFIDEKNVN